MFTGFLGGLLTGIFAEAEGCAAFGVTNPGGAIDRNGRQVWLQIVGALFIIGWNLVWTSLILLFIKHVLRIPLRMTEQQMIEGDDAIHGEYAYCFADDVTGLVPSQEVIEGVQGESPDNSGPDLESGIVGNGKEGSGPAWDAATKAPGAEREVKID